MAFEIYLQSYLNGAPGGGDEAGALSVLTGFAAEQDEFGAWQVDLSDGLAAEITGLVDLQATEEGEAPALSCLVRLTGLAPQTADFLYALAQGAAMVMIVPVDPAAGGDLVLYPVDLDPGHLPEGPPFDSAQAVDGGAALRRLLAPLVPPRWPVADDMIDPVVTDLRRGWVGWVSRWFRGG